MSSERVRVRVARRVLRARVKVVEPARNLAPPGTTPVSSGTVSAPAPLSSAAFSIANAPTAILAPVTPPLAYGTVPPQNPSLAHSLTMSAIQAAVPPTQSFTSAAHGPTSHGPASGPLRPSGPARITPSLGPLDLERARREGMAEGERQGREAARRELGTLAVRLADALADAKRRTDEELDGLELRLADVALAVAERILGCEVAAGRYDLVAVLERSLVRARAGAGAEVRLNPIDLEPVSQATVGMSEAAKACRFVADAAVPRGELVLETPAGRIVHSILAELETVRRAIRDGEAAA